MYKVLIADDEKLVADGISQLISWKKLDLNLIGVAYNGNDALALVKKYRPEIVITDIRMPGIDGLELIKEIKKASFYTKSIILSGYNSFDYAKEAMSYGVRFFLEKPCTEEKIFQALEETKRDLLNEQLSKDMLNYLNSDKKDLSRIYLQTRLEDCIKEQKLFLDDPESQQEGRLLVCKKRNKKYLNGFLESFFDESSVIAEGEKAEWYYRVINIPLAEQVELIKALNGYLEEQTYLNIMFVLTDVFRLRNIASIFFQAIHCFDNLFYIKKNNLFVMTKEEKKTDNETLLKYMDQIKINLIHEMGKGNYESSESLLYQLFAYLDKYRYPVNLVRLTLGEFYFDIVRQFLSEQLDGWNEVNIQILNSSYLEDIQYFFLKLIADKKQIAYGSQGKSHQIVYQMNLALHQFYQSEELSLKWVAQNVIFLSSDYLGKIYYSITGERYSTAIMNYRMKKAEKLLNENRYKIYEVAEKIGFGENSEYFSQVFKKYKGVTPTQYVKTEQVEKNH